jgi:hypothetical protein
MFLTIVNYEYNRNSQCPRGSCEGKVVSREREGSEYKFWSLKRGFQAYNKNSRHTFPL